MEKAIIEKQCRDLLEQYFSKEEIEEMLAIKDPKKAIGVALERLRDKQVSRAKAQTAALDELLTDERKAQLARVVGEAIRRTQDGLAAKH